MNNIGESFLERLQVDAFFVSNYFNILYFSGFKTLSSQEREAFFLITKKGQYIFTDGRYAENRVFPREKNRETEIRILTPQKGLVPHLQEIIHNEKIGVLGFEKEDIRYQEYETLKSNLTVRLLAIENVGLTYRAVKKEKEITHIERAATIGDEALQVLSKQLHIGMSEKEIAWKLEHQIRSLGYELSFDPIVAVDVNAAIPHYDTKGGDGIVKNGSVILIDYGVMYNNYCSDSTRMFFVGDVSDEIHRAYEYLKHVQEKTVHHLETANTYREVDVYCRSELTKKYPETYPHSTGHGVGLEVHEFPKVSSRSNDVVAPGHVCTIEPGIYVAGRWGMRIEDTIAVGKDKNIKVLTRFPV